jgi:hypothetical protein
MERDADADHSCHGGKAHSAKKTAPVGVGDTPEQEPIGPVRIFGIQLE